MENNQPTELTKEEFEMMELAVALSKEVLQEKQVNDISEYVEEKYDGQKCTFYKICDERNVRVFVKLEYVFGIMKIEFYLNFVTYEIISILKKLFSDETAHEILKPPVIRKLKDKHIGILTLFDFEESEVKDEINFVTKKILSLFLQNIPFIASASVVDALSSSMFGYYQNTVREQMRDHWTNLGLPKDFNLILDSDIEKIRKSNNDRRKWFLGDKKQNLNEWAIKGLADTADNLREQYKLAKKRYKEAKNSFESLNRRQKDDEWLERWSETWFGICSNEFPNLYYPATKPENIEFRPPYELVLIQLADFYDYDEEYMKKKITYSRSLKNKANR